MSDTVLQTDAFRRGRRWSGGQPWLRRLRLKRLGGGMVDYVTEVFAEMEQGRQVRPVISAYKPPRR